MLVLAAVSDVQHQRLRGAVTPRFALARAQTWDVALETIKGRPVEIAVVDPMLGGARGQEVERLRVLFPSLPFILYTPVMTPELAPVLLQMGKCGISQVVLSRTEDHPDRLRDLLSAEAMHAASHRLLQDPGFTIEDVAKRLGYAQAKTFQQHARKYLGLTAGEMKLSLTADQATARIVEGFLTPAMRAAASAS